MSSHREPPLQIIAEQAGEWMLPYWLERQTNPASPSFTPAAPGCPVTNVTHRNHIPIGTLGSPQVATVDPRGLVTPWPGGWALDWWAGADDRWRIPCREAGVRQTLVGNAPVVETTMRVPGGDLVERVWAFHDSEAGDVLAVEVENASRAPLALALAIRPFGVEGHQPVHDIAVSESAVVVNGRHAMWLPKPAPRTARSTRAGGDVARAVMTGEAASTSTLAVTCPDGFAQAALVFPLSHSSSLRVLIPLNPELGGRPGPVPTAVPPADAVSRGWQSHSGRNLRLSLPDGALNAAFDAARNQLLLAAASRSMSTGNSRETAAVVRALGRCGLTEEAARIVASLPEGQGPGGQLGGDDPSRAATGAVLHAAGAHWALGRDAELVEAMVGPLAAGAHHRPGVGRIARRSQPPLDPVESGWQLRGALDVAEGLAATGQSEAAAEIHRRCADLAQAVEVGMGTEAQRDPSTDPLARLDLIMPLQVVPATSTEASVLLERLRGRTSYEAAVLQRRGTAGLSPEHTARLAQAELRRGERVALDRIGWLVSAGGSAPAWPDLIHPRTGGGTAGAPWSPGVAAALVELVTDLVAYADPTEEGPAQLVLCPVLPESWLGGNFEVHDLVTRIGLVSYGVRWHGERPALLWEFIPHDGVGPVRITIPGLDPDWSTTELRGDALLAVPPLAVELANSATESEPEPAEHALGLSIGVKRRTENTGPLSPPPGPLPRPGPVPPVVSPPSPAGPLPPPEDGDSFT